jgi:hypothetical protein
VYVIEYRGGDSLPGAADVIVKTFPGSPLIAELQAAGYALTLAGEGERIIAGSIVEQLTLTSSGAFEPATAESTRPVHIRTHAGVCKVERWSFSLA